MLSIVKETLLEDTHTIINLPEPGERGKLEGRELWCNAGATAVNKGREAAVEDGYTWGAHLDDDDEWAPDHLQHLSAGIRTYPDAVLVHTLAQYLHVCNAFPVLSDYREISRGQRACVKPSLSSNVMHSAVAIHLCKLRDMPYPTRGECPADARMWSAIEEKWGYHSVVHVPAVTVWHLQEYGGGIAAKRNRLIFRDRGLEQPCEGIQEGSVAYVRFDEICSASGVAEALQKWVPALTPGGVILFKTVDAFCAGMPVGLREMHVEEQSYEQRFDGHRVAVRV